MEILKQLLGRLHPLIVHLPIGFLLLGLLLQWADRNTQRYPTVLPTIFLWGGITALTASVTGYLQYLGEGYAFETVKWHLWLGLLTTLITFALYLRLKLPPKAVRHKKLKTAFISMGLLVAVFLTGHQGGTITHGQDYLLEPLPDAFKKKLGMDVYEPQLIELSEAEWQEAPMYTAVIKPILNNNCVSCHNSKKFKGGLNLSSPEKILEGGENGEIITPDNPEKSPLYKRLILPEDHDDHMPPKGKIQPGKDEIGLIREWIINGSSFDKSIGELGLDKSLFASYFPKTAGRIYPDSVVAAASLETISDLKTQGIHVQRISAATNYLSVSCLNYPEFGNKNIAAIRPIAQQIAILDLGGTQVTDSILGQLALFPNLTTLKLDRTSVTGDGLIKLATLSNLRVLNLTDTPLKSRYLKDLYTFKTLQAVYLYNTGLTERDIPEGIASEHGYLQFGDFELPVVPSDSIMY